MRYRVYQLVENGQPEEARRPEVRERVGRGTGVSLEQNAAAVLVGLIIAIWLIVTLVV